LALWAEGELKRRAKKPHRSDVAPARGGHVPVVMLSLLLFAFAGALGLKAWEEARLADSILLRDQLLLARQAAARIDGVVLTALARAEAVGQRGARPSEIVRSSGLSDVATGEPKPVALVDLVGSDLRVHFPMASGSWGAGTLATAPILGELRIDAELTNNAPVGARFENVAGRRHATACARLTGSTAVVACVSSLTPMFPVASIGRLLTFALLAAAPALAVLGLVRAVRRAERKATEPLPPRVEPQRQPEVPGLLGYWRWSPADRTLHLSPEGAAILRLRSRLLAYDDMVAMTAEADRHKVAAALRELTPFSQLNLAFQFGHSPAIAIEMFGGAVDGSYGGAILNATDKMAAIQRSRRAEGLARTAIDAHPGPFAIWDARRRLTHWNAVFARDFNLDADVLHVGASYDFVMAEAGKFVRVERPMGDDPNGRELLLLSDRWIRLVDRRTSGEGSITVGIDLTSLKRHEGELSRNEKRLRAAVSELERAEGQARELASRYAEEKLRAERALQAKGVFLANMSHELRTPLNAINGFSEMIAAEVYGPLGDPRYKGYAEDILNSGQHLLDMINDILDMAKIEAGKMRIDPRPIDPSEAVDAAVRLIRRRASDRQVTLHFDPDDDLPEINGDHRAIKQMALNLLSNAIKFTDPGGEVRVEVVQESSWIAIRVSDTGVGIPEADLPRLAQPFEQARSPDGRNTGGTGLGLALTKSFAEMHGGSLAIESKLGVGTVVTIRLPISARTPTGAIAPREFATEEG
jgi:two-component system, cell cycle sensor histidine kinase PleC